MPLNMMDIHQKSALVGRPGVTLSGIFIWTPDVISGPKSILL